MKTYTFCLPTEYWATQYSLLVKRHYFVWQTEHRAFMIMKNGELFMYSKLSNKLVNNRFEEFIRINI
jgi:hypothetical protein